MEFCQARCVFGALESVSGDQKFQVAAGQPGNGIYFVFKRNRAATSELLHSTLRGVACHPPPDAEGSALLTLRLAAHFGRRTPRTRSVGTRKKIPPQKAPSGSQLSITYQEGGLMDAFTQQLLAIADKLAALADQLPAGEQRQQLVDQIAALNVAITQHGQG